MDRPKSIKIDLAPYIGLINYKYLSKEPAEIVTELSEEILSDVYAMRKGLRYSQKDGSQAWGTNLRGVALAHPQVNTRPYAFFVVTQVSGTRDGVFFNPKILEKQIRKNKNEKCLSYPYHGKQNVVRYMRILVQYQTIEMVEEGSTEMRLSDVKEEWIEGMMAQVFQHETDHINGKGIW